VHSGLLLVPVDSLVFWEELFGTLAEAAAQLLTSAGRWCKVLMFLNIVSNHSGPGSERARILSERRQCLASVG
jgi:hypothetical protein